MWCGLFATGLGLVVVSKVHFIGWGTGLPALEFKALSGHAMLTTSIYPVLAFLLLQRCSPGMRTSGAMAGILFGALMGTCLVAFEFHTLSETVGGFAIGAAVCLGFVRGARGVPTLHANRWQLPCALLVFAALWGAEPASVEYWMTDVALHLSGRGQPFSFAVPEVAHR